MTTNFNLNDLSLNTTNITFQELWDYKCKLKGKKDLTLKLIDQYLYEYKNFSTAEIIQEFSYSKIKISHPEFCKLFKDNKLCHNLPPDTLNCLTCFCPNYLLEVSFDNDQQLYRMGKCIVNSNSRQYKQTSTKTNNPKNVLILNCANCTLPHQPDFINSYLASKL